MFIGQHGGTKMSNRFFYGTLKDGSLGISRIQMEDGVEISSEQIAEMRRQQAAGKNMIFCRKTNDFVQGHTANQIRAERNRRLRMSDWTQIPDSAISAEKRAQWAVYRQQLRDLPMQKNFPNCEFPQEPKQ